jgi:hypothetical protein
MRGAEYLSPHALATLWTRLDAALRDALAESHLPLSQLLRQWHPAWNVVGRVHSNLAENRGDPDAPFAFLATYTTRLSAQGRAQHQPLSAALAEFSGARKKEQLLSLLLPVQRAAQRCDWLSEMVEAGEIYHPLRWTPDDALRLLRDAAGGTMSATLSDDDHEFTVASEQGIGRQKPQGLGQSLSDSLCPLRLH